MESFDLGRRPPVARPNPNRRRPEEWWAAQRIAFEQRRRRWSNAELATRLTAAGCPIDQSAISKIYKGKPKPRAISTNELAAFAQVLELPVAELLRPLRSALSAQANDLLEELDERRSDVVKAASAAQDVLRRVALFTGDVEALDVRFMDALVAQESALVLVVDLLLEAEAALTGEDAWEVQDKFWPDED